MSAFIPVIEAAEMNDRYRMNRELILKPEYQGKNILCICETFEKDQIQTLLDKEGCTALRIYFGMDDQLKLHCVLVASNAGNADILPSSTTSLNAATTQTYTLETGQRCPDDCPEASILNGFQP